MGSRGVARSDQTHARLRSRTSRTKGGDAARRPCKSGWQASSSKSSGNSCNFASAAGASQVLVVKLDAAAAAKSLSDRQLQHPKFWLGAREESSVGGTAVSDRQTAA